MPMLLTELHELLRHGENSGVEFKRDDVHPDSLAKEIAALANLEGGQILLGVEDDGSIAGLTRTPKMAEEWAMNVCRDHLQPPFIPYWETVKLDDARQIGVITIPADCPDKPYKARRGSAWITFMTVTDIELSLYSDRLEVISPGRLPNTVTVEKMKQGYRAARNELMKEILRDYGYVEHRGMGVRNRIIAGMRQHNGTEPDLIEQESRFIVRLWKEKRKA